MARFSAEGLSYPQACQLIDSLKRSGLDANISTGAVAIYCETAEDVSIAQDICKTFGASFSPGGSAAAQEYVLMTNSGSKMHLMF